MYLIAVLSFYFFSIQVLLKMSLNNQPKFIVSNVNSSAPIAKNKLSRFDMSTFSKATEGMTELKPIGTVSAPNFP